MSASAAIEALVHTVQGALGPEHVTREDYEIIARRAPWAAVVSLEGGSISPWQMGGGFRERWDLRVTLYVATKDGSRQPLRRITEGVDRIVQAILQDVTLGGVVKQTAGITVYHEPGTAMDIGGSVWVTAFVRVSVEIF